MPSDRALIVIDVQHGFEDPSLGPRDNPACEENIAALIAAWRERGAPIVFVRHDSGDDFPLTPGTPGNAFKDVIAGEPDLAVVKDVHSAFLGTPDLAAWLREREIDAIAICGITTNHCCETTARMGSDMGYDVSFVLDATHAFDQRDLAGTTIPAAELARITASNLDGEFATVVMTADVIAR